jgi:hypothetical protein
MGSDAPSQTPEAGYRALAEALLGSHEANELLAVKPGHRFGAQAMKIDGRIFAMLTRGRLVLKLPRARVEALIDAGIGGLFDAGKGRAMKEWVSIAEGQESAWLALAQEAMAFAARGKSGAASR